MGPGGRARATPGINKKPVVQPMKETKAEDDPEQQFAALLMHKFQLFRNLILETINAEHEKALVFT